MSDQKSPERAKTNPTTVENISKPNGLNSQEFSADLLRDLLAVTVYGKTFADPDKAERYKRGKIRAAMRVINAQREITKTPLGEILEAQQGVLDAHIAKADKHIPIIQAEIRKKRAQLQSDNLKPYQRGRMMRDLEDLKDREATHVQIRETCIDQLNQFYESSDESDSIVKINDLKQATGPNLGPIKEDNNEK